MDRINRELMQHLSGFFDNGQQRCSKIFSSNSTLVVPEDSEFQFCVVDENVLDTPVNRLQLDNVDLRTSCRRTEKKE